MPSFPRYESKEQIAIQPTSVGTAKVTTGEILGGVAKVAQQAQDVTLKLIEAHDKAQKSTSEINQKTQIADMLGRAQAETDYNALDSYLKENEKFRIKSLGGFTSKAAGSEAALARGYDAKIAEIQLRNLFRKKEIDLHRSNTLAFIDLEINNPTAESLGKIKQRLADDAGFGFFDQEDAYKLYQSANNALGVNRINKDLYEAQTPEQVDIVQEGITNGFYERGGVTIDPVKKRALLGIADSARKNTEKKIIAQQIEAMAQNRVETITGVASGQINPETLNIAAISEYDPQLGSTLTKVKEFMINYNPKIPLKQQRISMTGVLSPNKLMQARDYARSVDAVFAQDDNEKLGEFVLRELNKKGDGTTPSTKLVAFMQLAALKVKANNPQTPEDGKAAKRLAAIKGGLKFLESSNPYLAPTAIGDLIVGVFLSGASTEEQVMEEAKTVLKDKILDRYKSVARLPSIPNMIVDGEASAENLQSGFNELQGEQYSGSYGD